MIFFNETATPEIYTLSLHDALPIYADIGAFAETVRRARRLGFRGALVVHPSQVAVLNEAFAPTEAELDWARRVVAGDRADRKSTRLNSSHANISYAVFCLKKKTYRL